MNIYMLTYNIHVYITGGKNVNKKNILRDLEGSLKRLNTDYIDVYLLHVSLYYSGVCIVVYSCYCFLQRINICCVLLSSIIHYITYPMLNTYIYTRISGLLDTPLKLTGASRSCTNTLPSPTIRDMLLSRK